MVFKIILTRTAADSLQEIERTDPAKLRKVRKTLGLLQTNTKHPSLQTHEFRSLSGPHGERVFEAYVESKTPAAFWVFWYYGPGRDQITIIAVTRRPGG